jgi:hypothetical protein
LLFVLVSSFILVGVSVTRLLRLCREYRYSGEAFSGVCSIEAVRLG